MDSTTLEVVCTLFLVGVVSGAYIVSILINVPEDIGEIRAWCDTRRRHKAYKKRIIKAGIRRKELEAIHGQYFYIDVQRDFIVGKSYREPF